MYSDPEGVEQLCETRFLDNAMRSLNRKRINWQILFDPFGAALLTATHFYQA
jgi:hypothetical protein